MGLCSLSGSRAVPTKRQESFSLRECWHPCFQLDIKTDNILMEFFEDSAQKERFLARAEDGVSIKQSQKPRKGYHPR